MTLDKLFKTYEHNFHNLYIIIFGFIKRTLSVAGIECIDMEENERIRTQGRPVGENLCVE